MSVPRAGLLPEGALGDPKIGQEPRSLETESYAF